MLIMTMTTAIDVENVLACYHYIIYPETMISAWLLHILPVTVRTL